MDIIKNATEAATEVTTIKRGAVKARAADIIEEVQNAKGTRTEMIKRMQNELGISYANAYYYISRVFQV